MTDFYNIPKMGIYEIRCLVDGRVYVGQSRRLRGRWLNHQRELRLGIGVPKLQKAWNIHGEKAFRFQVLELVNEPLQLCAREQYYIDLLRAFEVGFNTLPKAGSFEGYTPDEEARAKIGAASRARMLKDPELQKRMVAASRACGYQPTEEHRKRIGEAQKGIPRGPMSEETRQRIHEAKVGKAPWAAVKANTGRPLREETKKKIGDANRHPMKLEHRLKRTGYKASEAHKQAMSRARKGVPWTPARWAALLEKKQEKQIES